MPVWLAKKTIRTIKADHNQTTSSVDVLPSLLHQRCSQKTNVATGEHRHPLGAQRYFWKVPSTCRSQVLTLVLLFALPRAVKGHFQPPRKSASSSPLLHSHSLHHSIFCELKKHFAISLHESLTFSFCTPKCRLLPAFCHQQTSSQTDRSRTHLSDTQAYSLLHLARKGAAIMLELIKREIQIMMLAVVNRNNCPNVSELDLPSINTRAPTHSSL